MEMHDGYWYREPGGQALQLSTSSCYAVASPSATSSLSSPSSGYSSADEGRATPFGESGGWTDCLLSSDPYLGELVMTPTNGTGRRSTDVSTTMPSSWSGASLALDDFMDTLWDSLTSGSGVDASTRPPDTGGWSADTEMLVDSATGRLTKRCPLTTSTTTTAATCCGYSESVNGYSSTFAGENGLVGIISDVDDGLRTSSSGSVFVGPPLSVACRMDLDASAAAARRRLSDGGIHRHMAGLMDIATSDADDYLPKRAGNTVDRVTDMPPPSAPVTPQAGPGAPGRLLGGVLSQQRSASNSMLHAATSSSSRVRGAVLAKSCGDALLQRAAVGMSTSAVTSGTAGRSSSSASSTPRSRGSPACAHHHSSARVAGIRSSLSLSSSRLPDVGTGSSATRVPSYLALDDHRYTLRGPPPPNPQPPPSKIQKTGSRSSGMRQSASSGSLVGVTSILEAFLRTTRPIDPNKGSNAALAAAGLSHLPLGGNRAAATQTTAADHGVDDDASGTLLKKLLTGEIDQSSFSAAGERTSTTKTITSSAEQTATNTVTADVGCLLAEGFGFDGDLYLDDPQSMSLSLLDDVADDGLWMTAHTDDFDEKLMSSELDEILREQNRQDDLCLQHYITELL